MICPFERSVAGILRNVYAKQNRKKGKNMKPTTLYNKIIREISKAEGKKKSVSVGNVREIVGIIADMVHSNQIEMPFRFFNDLGIKRAKRVKKK